MAANLSAEVEAGAAAAAAPEAAAGGHNLPALLFGVLLIVVIICGNLLVCLSVFTEKALKTTTNYFIVSLAVADLMLAVLVLPLFVYTEVRSVGNALSVRENITLGIKLQDGTRSCCSNLVSHLQINVITSETDGGNEAKVDGWGGLLSRTKGPGAEGGPPEPDYHSYFLKVKEVNQKFIAVLIPLAYNRKHVDLRQAVLLSATWIMALAVASPIMFGINDVPGRDPTECKLENDDYVLYSSVCSFFIPCPIMVLLYCGMFRGLRRWEEARKAKLKNSIQACRKLQEAATSLPPLASLPPPLPPIIERELTENLDQPSTFPSTEKPLHSEYRDGPVHTVSFTEIKFNPDPRRRKTAKINNRERKAMKVLPVVV
ncbi:hypothetical protein FQN60_014324, partial [Etheostoma spectabile]